MPGLVKIGCTDSDPKIRAKKISTTGVPGNFEVKFYIDLCGKAFEIEKRIHTRLSRERIRGKEFFEITVETAIETVWLEIKMFISENVCKSENANHRNIEIYNECLLTIAQMNFQEECPIIKAKVIQYLTSGFVKYSRDRKQLLSRDDFPVVDNDEDPMYGIYILETIDSDINRVLGRTRKCIEDKNDIWIY